MSLETTAAQLAAERIDEDLLRKIEENLVLTKKCIDKPDQLVKADIEFHDLVAEAAGNHALLVARAPLGELLLPAYGEVTKYLAQARGYWKLIRRYMMPLKKAMSK